MKIRLKLLAGFRHRLPEPTADLGMDLELADGATLGDALEAVGVPIADARIAIVNGIAHVDPAAWQGMVLADGDTAAILPNVH